MRALLLVLRRRRATRARGDRIDGHRITSVGDTRRRVADALAADHPHRAAALELCCDLAARALRSAASSGRDAHRRQPPRLVLTVAPAAVRIEARGGHRRGDPRPGQRGSPRDPLGRHPPRPDRLDALVRARPADRARRGDAAAMTGTWPWHWWTDELTEHLTIAWPGRRHPALSRRDRRRRTQSDTAHGRVANCQVIVTRVSSKSESAVRQTVILAGGQGTRLRPYTDDRPKPLIEIGGRPILEHQMRWLAAGGIEQVVVSCGYRADVLRSWVDARELPVTVSVVVEDEPLGRGGGLKYAARALPFVGERWMGLNGDVLTRFPIETFAERHHAHQAATTIAVTPLKSPYGIVGVTDDDRIERFVEAPVLPHWINAGIYLFEPWVTARLPDLGDQEDSTFPELAREGTLAAYRIDGYWRSIDTAKDVGKASRELAKLGWDTELVVR